MLSASCHIKTLNAGAATAATAEAVPVAVLQGILLSGSPGGGGDMQRHLWNSLQLWN